MGGKDPSLPGALASQRPCNTAVAATRRAGDSLARVSARPHAAGIARIGRERDLRLVLGVLVAAFAALTTLVELGALTGIDQFALQHLMPAFQGLAKQAGPYSGLYRPFGVHTSWWIKLIQLWTYPCSVLLSSIIVAAGVYLASRRGGRRIAVALAAAWVIGNVVEVVGKGVIRRPALWAHLHGLRIHVSAFDSSFPSGHMIRGTIVLAMLTLLWPGATRRALAWFALVGPCLVVSAAHTPSDVLGGLIVGVLVVGVVLGLETTSRFGGEAGRPSGSA